MADDRRSPPTKRRQEILDGKKARSKRRYRQRKAEGGKGKEPTHTPEECAQASWLKPWHFKKGYRPPGRPKKLPITERLEWAIELPLPEAIEKLYGMPKGSSIADLIAYRAAIHAAEGNSRASAALCELIADRIEGKPITRTAEPSGDSIVPPALNVSFVKGKK